MTNEQFLWEGEWIENSQGIPDGLNRAFRYGDGLFETIRVIDGQPHLWELHMQRLKAGMKQLYINHDHNFFETLESEAKLVIDNRKVEEGGVLRIWVYRSGGGKYTPSSNQASRILACEPLGDNFFTLNKKGLKVEIAESIQLNYSSLSPYKTLNALPYILASREKEERGFDDLLIVNSGNKIVEACSSNVFWVKKQEVITPPVSDGCVAGVMRSNIIEVIQDMNYNLSEDSLSMSSLSSADELFFTNSVSGVQWVGAFRKKRFFNKLSLKIIERLNRAISN